VAKLLNISIGKAKAVGFFASIGAGFTLAGVGEYAFAIVLWMVAAIAATAILWPNPQRGHAAPLRVVACLPSLICLVLLPIWTVAKKGDEPWTNFARLIHKNAPPELNRPSTPVATPSTVQTHPVPQPLASAPTKTSIPAARPPAKQPTFTESPGDFVVIIGGTPHKISHASTRQNPTHIAPFGDSRAIKAYVEHDRLYVDALLHYAPDKAPLQLLHNNLRDRPSQWDRNFDDSAIEIVDEKLTPRFQLIYKDPRTAVLRGVFQFPGGAVVFEDRSRFFVGSLEGTVRIARLFKYPSRLHQSEELSSPAPPTQSCPNGICIAGDNTGSAVVNNLAPPAAKLTFTEDLDTSLSQTGEKILRVHIHTDRSIPGAVVAIVCSEPVEYVKAVLHGAGHTNLGWGRAQGNFQMRDGSILPPENGLIIIVNIPAAFLPGQEIEATIKSKADARVLSVNPVEFVPKE
jgi:hypothetical protein